MILKVLAEVLEAQVIDIFLNSLFPVLYYDGNTIVYSETSWSPQSILGSKKTASHTPSWSSWSTLPATMQFSILSLRFRCILSIFNLISLHFDSFTLSMIHSALLPFHHLYGAVVFMLRIVLAVSLWML